jgi:hypothetical protein
MAELPTLPPIATEPISVILLPGASGVPREEIVSSWLTFLNGLDREYELLVVGVGAVAAAEHDARVRMLPPERPGLGAALRTGLAAARFPLVVHAPGDGEFQPDDLKRLLAEIDKAHIVSAFRVRQPVPRGLRWLGWIVRPLARLLFAVSLEPLPGWPGWRAHLQHYLSRVLFALRVRDVGSSFRLYRRSILPRIPIQSDSSFALVEVLAKANFLGHVMTETPVPQGTPAVEGEKTGRVLADGCRVFRQPDFGPGVLPTPQPGMEGT